MNIFKKKTTLTKGSIVMYKKKIYYINIISDDKLHVLIDTVYWIYESNAVEYGVLVSISDLTIIKR